MRIHTDALNHDDFTVALRLAGLDDVWVEDLSVHGSRKRRRGYEVRLAAEQVPGRRHRMHAPYGADSLYAATYGEHGRWIAQLYELDPNAIVGPYKGRDDFHRVTKGAYLPE